MAIAAVPWAENTCTICGETSTCTPSNDFYVEGIVPNGAIACERCFRRLRAANAGVPEWMKRMIRHKYNK